MKPFDGDIDDYRRLVLEGPQTRGAQRSSVRNEAQERRRAAAGQREQTAPLRKKIRETEALIDKLQKEIQRIDVRLADPALYARDSAGIVEQGKARADAVRALAEAEERWLELSADHENQSAGTL